jgi:hypothetical protein
MTSMREIMCHNVRHHLIVEQESSPHAELSPDVNSKERYNMNLRN